MPRRLRGEDARMWPGRGAERCLAEGARFEASTVSETIELDRISLVCSQSLTEESEADQEPVKPDRTR